MNAGMPVRLFLELTGFGLPLHYSECPKSGSVPGTPLKPHIHTYKHTPLHTHTPPHTHKHTRTEPRLGVHRKFTQYTFFTLI